MKVSITSLGCRLKNLPSFASQKELFPQLSQPLGRPVPPLLDGFTGAGACTGALTGFEVAATGVPEGTDALLGALEVVCVCAPLRVRPMKLAPRMPTQTTTGSSSAIHPGKPTSGGVADGGGG
jgi:hypothetical protein